MNGVVGLDVIGENIKLKIVFRVEMCVYVVFTLTGRAPTIYSH